MFNVGDQFVLVATEGQATTFGEVGVTYTVTAHRGTRYWMSHNGGGWGIAGVPETELADTAIWQPVTP